MYSTHESVSTLWHGESEKDDRARASATPRFGEIKVSTEEVLLIRTQ